MFKKRFPSLSSLGSDGNTAFLRAARAGQLDKVLEHLKSNIDINTSNANGLNALHLASKDGHVNVVTELLKRGATVDAATKKGNTALHIASLAGQEEVVKLLIQSGAAVNVQSQNGFTPLYMAAQENHDNVVRFLLANGANQSLSTEDGFTPLAVAMQQGHDKVVAVLLESDTRGKVRLPALHIAAKKDDCKAAALLLKNEHNPDVTSKSGFTPLHIAAHYGNENIANLLLSKGADVNYSAKHNITPLHVAAKWGKSNMVALLLEKGGNIESKTRDGLTPLHCAARSGHEQVVDMLLERGAPISSKTKNGLAPLHMASQGDHVDAARILLYHRAPVDEVTVDYLTALHVAAHCGHVRVAKLLLDRKADPDARALNGFTPLHIACKKNRIKVVELLLKHGASIEATTESGLTPLHVASFMGCMNIVIFLLQHNANPDVPTVRGETPLHLAARANQTDIIRILLRNGAQVDARAREQQTPLHIASRLGNVDIVMLLLQHGAQIDATTKDLYTALHIAAKEGQEEVAGVLLENGANLKATTKKGFTPLHLAAKYGNMKVAQQLLQRDALVDAQGKNGVTPLHVASHYDNQAVALLLLDKGASPHATAKNGHTPLHIAARKNQMDIATTLLEYGAKADAESKAGFTPLHLASQEGHTDMTKLLIEHHADGNHTAKNGLTPLHLCAQEDKPNVASILVKNGAQVDATTKAGYTPLHVASHFGQVNTVRYLLQEGADVSKATSIGYTPLHQAAQQGHATIVQLLLNQGASPNTQTSNGQTPLSIAQKLGYISVVEALKGVTTADGSTPQSDEKYRVVAPETMQETFMSDSEDENGDDILVDLSNYGQPAHAQHIYQGQMLLSREDTVLSDQPYRYLTVDEMKSLGDDSLPIDVTKDERFDSNKDSFGMTTSIEDSFTMHHVKASYAGMQGSNNATDNVDVARQPLNIGFLVSFLVDARGGAMRGCRHSGVRVIIPPRKATMPMRVTCRYLKRDKLIHPPPLMEGEALASRVLELGPVGAKFLGPVIIEVPHFASLRGSEREIVILRSDNGETWREHTMEATEDIVQDVLNESFDAEELSQMEDLQSGRITRILTNDFPQYFAILSRVRQEVHPIGSDGGMVSSSVVPQVQAVFPQGALTKKIKVGLQAQPIPAELTAKLLGNRVAVSPIVTVEPRRRKFHKPITLTIPVPRAANKGMINQYSGDAPTLRLLCSITGGTSRAQWEDVTGSTPLTFVNDCVSFTTTVSARFWLMDCRNVGEATKMATELYREAIHVPFMAKFVVFAKRVDTMEARLRVFCMTDDKEDKTLEHQEHFTEVAKSRDVEVLEGKQQYVELAGNLVPVTKSGDQLQLGFKAFRENRLPFTVRVKDPHVDSIGRLLFMKEAKVSKGDPPQQPMCCLNIVLPETIMPDSSLSEPDLYALQKKISAMKDSGIEIRRNDLRLSDISNLLGYDWIVLAPHLDIDDSDINLIKMENPGNEAQQARAMLRLWLYLKGYKASSKSLEKALHRINRDDVSEQCIQTQKLKSKYTTQKDENTNQRILFTDDSDIIKDADSIEYILHKTSSGRIKTDETDEKKYLAEEKDVPEEKKTVKERKQEIEKRLSQGEVQYPSPATKTQSEPFERQITVKEKVMQFQDKEKGGGGDPAQRDSTTKVIKTTENIIISQKEDFTRTSGRKQPTEQAEEELRRITDENRRRDSQLLENVTEGLGKISRKDDTQKGPQTTTGTTWAHSRTTEHILSPEEWTEKGQSEEYAYETKGVLSGQVVEPQSKPNDEEPQTTKKPKSDRETMIQVDDKVEGVKFYELNDGDEEQINAKENEPVPQVTMPSYKKRVHSQRIPQRERPAVTPYEGSYDQNYTSDEDNVEYEVDEPEDVMDRSCSSVTFSEEIYDSDTIDEMIKNQLRKQSQTGSNLLEVAPPKSILKDKGSKTVQGATKNASEKPEETTTAQSLITNVSSADIPKLPEISLPNKEIEKTIVPGKDLVDTKGETFLGHVTKPKHEITIKDTHKVTDDTYTNQDEKEIEPKLIRSTIPNRFEQVTDSATTNKDSLSDMGEKIVQKVTKPLQEKSKDSSSVTALNVLPELTTQQRPTTSAFEKTGDLTQPVEVSEDIITKTTITLKNNIPISKYDILTPLNSQESPTETISKEHKISTTCKEPKTEDTNKRILSPTESLRHILMKDTNKELEQLTLGKSDSLAALKPEINISPDKEELSKDLIFNKPTKPSRRDAVEQATELVTDIIKAAEDTIQAEKSGEMDHQHKEVEYKTIDSSKASENYKRPINEKLKLEIEKKISPEKECENIPIVPVVSSLQSESKTVTHHKIKTPEVNSSQLLAKNSTEASEVRTDETLPVAKNEPEVKEVDTSKVRKTSLRKISQQYDLQTFALESSNEADHDKKSVRNITNSEVEFGRKQETSQEQTNKKEIHKISNVDILGDTMKISENIILPSEGSETSMADNTLYTKPLEIISNFTSSLTGSLRDDYKTIMGCSGLTNVQNENNVTIPSVEGLDKDLVGNLKGDDILSDDDEIHDTVAKEIGSPDSDSKRRVIFRIESEDEFTSDAETEFPSRSEVYSPTGEFGEEIKNELKAAFEKEQQKLDQRLASLKSGIFDISRESLSRTKELVDERLRKISEVKPPKESDTAPPKHKLEKRSESEIKIGRFHITPTLVQEVLDNEEEIRDRLKTSRKEDEEHEEVEKELSEKLTEADFDEVIRELKLEGLKTEVFYQPEDKENSEKKEKTLKRVERRFERMASETLEKEKEEAASVSEEILDEKREVEFQRMVSQLSSEEVAESQQEYLQLWEEGGLSSLTPTDDWESRDPDTPEKELEEDSPKAADKHGRLTGDSKDDGEASFAKSKERGRPPLLSDISMDDDAEYDTTEHDWRHQLEILHAEADEDEIDQNLDAALSKSSYAPKK